MGDYFESEDEKRLNYLKRKLLQWKDKAKKMTKEVSGNRIAKWTLDAYKFATARKNWIDIADKYDIYINNSLTFQIK